MTKDGKHLGLRLRPETERMLRVFACMTCQSRCAVLESVLRCGLADAARDRGDDFWRAYRREASEAYYAAVDEAIRLGRSLPAKLEMSGDEDDRPRSLVGFRIRGSTVDALRAFARLADESLHDVADDAIRRRILYLATIAGDEFYEAWCRAVMYAMDREVVH